MSKKALGLIETYGYIGAIEALDSALKSANVSLAGIDFVKGGIVNVKVVGDVGAVKASIDAASKRAKDMNVYISSHVIARPSEDIEKIFLQEKKEQIKNIESNEEKIDSNKYKQEDIDEEDDNEIKDINEEKNENMNQGILGDLDQSKQELDPIDIRDLSEEEFKEEIKEYIGEIIESYDEEKSQKDLKEDIKEEASVNKEEKTNPINIIKKTKEELYSMKVVRLRNLARKLDDIGIERNKIKFANKKQLVEAICEYYERKMKK